MKVNILYNCVIKNKNSCHKIIDTFYIPIYIKKK